MKNFKRNTLICDFIEAAICLIMAFVLLMIYTGCSEDAGQSPVAHDGGYTEEQGVYALAGQGGNVYPKLLKMRSDESGMAGNPQNVKGSSFAKKGTPVVVYELDSLTLVGTGRTFVDTVYNDNGQFAFEKLSLNSPYVLIEIKDSCTAYEGWRRGLWSDSTYPMSYEVPCNYDSLEALGGALPSSCGITDTTKYPVPLGALVDLRKYKEISVNSLTYMKIPLVKKYVGEGMNFAAASKKAESEILEGYGIYEDLGNFESLESVNGDLSYVLHMVFRMMRRGSPFEVGLSDDMEFFYGVSPAAVAALGESAEQYYLNTLKSLEYEIAYFAHVKGYGQCTESRENETHSVMDQSGNEWFGLFVSSASIVCRSKKWVQGWKKIDFESGSMVDNRDGKTYKTVTYNWGGVTQTWMAQSLNYVDTASAGADSALKSNLLGKTKCDNGDPTCEIYGRFYMWHAAMNLGMSDLNLTSALLRDIVYEDEDDEGTEIWDTVAVEKVCLAADRNDSTKYEYCSGESETGECMARDTARSVFEYCRFKYESCRLDYSAFTRQSGRVVHQGVCPDGWRIPNKEDWELLAENVSKQGAILGDAGGSGFGYMDLTTMYFVDGETPELRMDYKKVGPGFASVPDVNDAREFAYVFYVSGKFSTGSSSEYYYGNIGFDDLYRDVYVRCIKN